MSIKTQKIIMFIPGVSFITFICWFVLCFKTPIRWLDYMKEWIKMFGIVVLATLIRMVCLIFISNEIVGTVFFVIWAYLLFFALSWFAVHIQEKMIEKSKQVNGAKQS